MTAPAFPTRGHSPGSVATVLDALAQRYWAAQLLRRGLRPGAARSLFDGLSAGTVSRLYREARHGKAPSGRLPSEFVHQAATGAELAAGAAMLADYLRLAGHGHRLVHLDPVLMVATWDRFDHLFGAAGARLDFTAFWLLLRGYRCGSIQLARCPRCSSYRLYFGAPSAPQPPCPVCAGLAAPASVPLSLPGASIQ